MWKTFNKCFVYYVEDQVAIKIIKSTSPSGSWVGAVYSPEQCMRTVCGAYSNNLEILKLKCLISAKEFGWNVNKIN